MPALTAQDLQPLLDALAADYEAYMDRHPAACSPAQVENFKAAFRNNLSVSMGAKYARIVCGGSAWGFVVLHDDDKKFKQGAILKPAGWGTPTRNFSRGNVLTSDLSKGFRWSGL